MAFNVYQGFWNLDTAQVNDNNLKTKYKNAITAKDPGVFGSINQKYGEDYAIDYFPVLSTVVLFYVLYLIIKYCIDIVVRMFKLFVLQMLGPLAITDYMVNGDSKDMFKSWTKTTISAYAMLFMRVFCIWFVAFITTLMNEKCTTVGSDGICTDSMLYLVEGQDPDYLLRALITLGLLAFLMDLPKLLSDIFGLDLEQDASVKGLMQKVGGAAKMVGLGAVTAGGAALGGAIGGLKGGLSAGKNLAGNKLQNKGKFDAKVAKKDSAYAQKMQSINNNKNLTNRQKSQQMNAARKDWMANNADAQETKDYKQANKTANMQAASQISAGAGGVARGALQGAIGALPVGKELLSGYNQGQSAVDKQQNERSKTFAETQGVQNNYVKGMADAANDLKVQAELSGKLTDVDASGVSTSIPGSVMVDNAYNAGQQAAEQTIKAEVVAEDVELPEQTIKAKVAIDDNAVSNHTVEATMNVDSSGVSLKPQELDISAKLTDNSENLFDDIEISPTIAVKDQNGEYNTTMTSDNSDS